MSELGFERLARGEICTQGAHALRWRDAGGRDVLFVSARSKFTAGTPIRGGIPIVFPWFGDDPEGHGRPAHGFARRVPWTLDAARTDRTQGRVAFALTDAPATRAFWPHAFALSAAFTFGDELVVDVAIDNRDAVPLRCEFALHTYLQVGDARAVEIRGLHGARYHDKATSARDQVQRDEVLRIAGEVDRTYVGTRGLCTLTDPLLRRTITVRQERAPSTVVWNPWIEKAARFADLAPDEWQRFVCIESGCIQDDAIVIAPGARHTLRTTFAVTAN